MPLRVSLRDQFLGKHHWKFMKVGAQLLENAERAQRRQNALAKDPEYVRRKASAHFLHIRGEGGTEGLEVADVLASPRYLLYTRLMRPQTL